MFLKKKVKSLVTSAIIITLAGSTLLSGGPIMKAEENPANVNTDEVVAPSSSIDWGLVQQLQSQFFKGPVVDYIDLDSLNPKNMSENALIGAAVHFQFVKNIGRDHLQPEKVLPFAVAAGINWLRTGYPYDTVADTMPATKMETSEYMDKWVDMEAELGINPLFQVNVPKRYVKQYKDNMEIFTQQFIQFVQHLMDTYGDKIGAIELVNEPYQRWGPIFGLQHFSKRRWGGSLWIDDYGKFAQEVAEAIKEKHPGMTVLNGNSEMGPTIGQLKLYPSTPIDVLNFHHYWAGKKRQLLPEVTNSATQSYNEHFVSSDTRLDRVVQDYVKQANMITGKDDLQLWITESGASMQSVDEIRQAKDILRVLTTSFMGVDKLFVFSLIDSGQNPENRGQTYGLVTDDYQPRRSYFAVARLNALTRGVASLDLDFKAIVTDVKVSAESGLPMWSQVVESGAGHDQDWNFEETIMMEKFNLEGDKALLAVWSTTRYEDYKPRRIEFAVNEPLGSKPILVDPLTGESEVLQTRKTPGKTSYDTLTLDVMDYPQFILIHE